MKHRVDFLGYLCTVGFIDAAGINPCIVQIVLASKTACFPDLPVSGFVCVTKTQVLKSYFVLAPSMRENGVFRARETLEFFELDSLGV
jgi:hypothetical protein